MMDWDTLYMSMVYLVGMKSKDKNTHLGAVVVGPDNEIRSTGYNSYVRGLNDNVDERQEPPEKYFWFEHAERNAIYNATLVGVSLKGCVMYTNGVPCMDCARAVIQSGIVEIVVDKEWNNDNSDKWKKSCDKAEGMLKEVGVNIRYFDGPILQIKKWRRGSEIE